MLTWRVVVRRNGHLEPVGPDPIQRGLEVIQNDRVAEAFKDKREFPERLDSGGQASRIECVQHIARFNDHEDNRETHRHQHYPEPWGDNHQLYNIERINGFDGMDEGDRRENPPGVSVELLDKQHLTVAEILYRKSGSMGRVVW